LAKVWWLPFILGHGVHGTLPVPFTVCHQTTSIPPTSNNQHIYRQTVPDHSSIWAQNSYANTHHIP